jgi:hypothetical protein
MTPGPSLRRHPGRAGRLTCLWCGRLWADCEYGSDTCDARRRHWTECSGRPPLIPLTKGRP